MGYYTKTEDIKAGRIFKFFHSKITPINQRRLENFIKNRRGYISFKIISWVFIITMFANVIANDRPLIVLYKGEILFPIVTDYPESKFGGFLANTDFKSKFVQDEIKQNGGWILWPPIGYSYQTPNRGVSLSSPVKPSWLLSKEDRCGAYYDGVNSSRCTLRNWNWLGQDDQGRDVLSRVIYGVRTSLVFGICVTFLSCLIGVFSGAIQGYFGGLIDLLFQRIIEIWNSIPFLYAVIIITSFLAKSFTTLIIVMTLFSWDKAIGIVRTEFFRTRNLDYVKAAKALGMPDFKIMYRHVFPNAMASLLTLLPFIMNSTISTLAGLGLLGFGLPPGSASLGEMLLQGKNNLQAPWLGITAFMVTAILLSLLIFVGEAVRDAFDQHTN